MIIIRLDLFLTNDEVQKKGIISEFVGMKRVGCGAACKDMDQLPMNINQLQHVTNQLSVNINQLGKGKVLVLTYSYKKTIS